MNTQIQKAKIRKNLLSRRSRMPEEDYLNKSRKIIDRLRQLSEFRAAQTIHCYVSMNERREVNTHPLLKELLGGRCEVIVPFIDTGSGTLTSVRLGGFDDLRSSTWGVLEPQTGEIIPEEPLDLVIVPMAGGDLNRNRIGYGKGFYDRFLQKVSCPKIGLLFEQCLVEEVPVEDFDVQLDKLVTEERVIG